MKEEEKIVNNAGERTDAGEPRSATAHEKRKIPYVGHVRIGNFKIWKSRMRLTVNDVSTPEERAEASRKGKKIKVRQKDVDVLNISDLQGTWSVKIPPTYLAYPMIEQCYAEGNDEFLHTYLANINFVTAISNGFYQRGVALVGHIYMNPEILRDGWKPEKGPGHDDLMNEAKKVRDEFLHWYDIAMEQERALHSREEDEKILKEDETAERAMEIAMR